MGKALTKKIFVEPGLADNAATDPFEVSDAAPGMAGHQLAGS